MFLQLLIFPSEHVFQTPVVRQHAVVSGHIFWFSCIVKYTFLDTYAIHSYLFVIPNFIHGLFNTPLLFLFRRGYVFRFTLTTIFRCFSSSRIHLLQSFPFQGPRSYFESGGGGGGGVGWLVTQSGGAENTFSSVTLYNFQKSGRAEAPPSPSPSAGPASMCKCWVPYVLKCFKSLNEQCGRADLKAKRTKKNINLEAIIVKIISIK